MGTVHAKEMADGPPETREIMLAEVPAKVKKVSIDGLGRTKDDIVTKQLTEVFEATNFEEMVFRAQSAKSRLEQLGIFRSINVNIDVSKGDGADPNGYEITYHVKEMRRVTGGASTLVGTNEGSLLFTMKFPNMLGRAEKLSTEYTYGTKNTTGLSVQYTKPLDGNPKVRFTSTAYQQGGEFPWSGFKETDRGIGADIMFPSALGAHSVKYEACWREVSCLSNVTSFAIREQAGHSFKSSIKHTFIRDTRDNPILPSTGSLMRVTQEVAGLGGDAHFHKHDIEFQINKTLFFDTVLQLSLAGGMVKPLKPEAPLKVMDKFLIGGPLTLRGFNLKGCGPHEDGNALGADTYWIGGLHVYTPLPFRLGQGGFGELFRTHLFLNAGNLVNLDLNNDPKENLQKLTNAWRLSYGVGIVFKLGGVARMELNYCVPLRVQPGDSTNPGVQFGVGVSFL